MSTIAVEAPVPQLEPEPAKPPYWTRRRVAAGIFVLWLLSGLYLVKPDQQAVETMFGKVVAPRVMPGLHYAWPWPIESVTKLKVMQLQRLVVGGDLPPKRIKLFRERGRVAGELVEMMEVHDHVQVLLERICDQEISFGKDGVGQSEIGCGAGIMMPGDRQTDVVETFGFDMGEIGFCIFRAPVLSRWCFQIIAQVRATEKFLRGSMRRRAAAGEWVHFLIIRRQNGARFRMNGHRRFRRSVQL